MAPVAGRDPRAAPRSAAVWRALALLLGGVPLTVTGAVGTETGPAAATYLTQLVGGLVLVIGIILVLAWMLRRIPGAKHVGEQPIKLLGVRTVGARERLVLVEVGGEQILVGVTPTTISHLHTLSKPVEVLEGDRWPSDFASLIKGFGVKQQVT